MNQFSIGVDLGGTNLRIAGVDEQGALVEKGHARHQRLPGGRGDAVLCGERHGPRCRNAIRAEAHMLLRTNILKHNYSQRPHHLAADKGNSASAYRTHFRAQFIDRSQYTRTWCRQFRARR